MAKIGLFGGTFDPIHNGHIQTALFILKEFELEKIIFIPANIPPNKSHKKITDGHTRLKMVELALHDYRKFLISSHVELERTGNSYTIDTIDFFQKTYPNDDFALMMGSDNLEQFTTWKNWIEIVEKVPLIVFRKHSDSLALPESLSDFSDRIHFSKSPLIKLSSTEIRNRIYSNKTLNLLIDHQVENYIRSNNLYR